MIGEAIIRGDGGEIRLQVLGRENVHAQNEDDANWLRANLSIEAGPFSGATALAVTTWDLLDLMEQLEANLRTLNGEMRFQNIESNWILNVKFETGGAAIIAGTVRPEPSRANTLNYEFRSDPISLEALVLELRLLNEIYPVVRMN